MATINVPDGKISGLFAMIWDYLDMRYPRQNILHSTTDDKIFVYHGHQLKVIEWLVNHKIIFEIIDYETLDNDLTEY